MYLAIHLHGHPLFRFSIMIRVICSHLMIIYLASMTTMSYLWSLSNAKTIEGGCEDSLQCMVGVLDCS